MKPAPGAPDYFRRAICRPSRLRDAPLAGAEIAVVVPRIAQRRRRIATAYVPGRASSISYLR